MTRAKFFPAPLPDETVFSLLSRYHLNSANDSATTSLDELVGSHSISPTSNLPGYIGELVARLPDKSPVTADRIIENNTLLSYYRPFRRRESVERAASGMVADRKDRVSVPLRIGAIPTLAKESMHPRFCLACIGRDLEEFGVAYWHRSHQLPGVRVCYRHEILLSEKCTLCPIDFRKPHHLYLPGFRCRRGHLLLIPDRMPWNREAVWLAKISHELLAGGLGSIDPDVLVEVYSQAAQRRGLNSRRGYVNHAAVTAAIELRYRSEFLQAMNLHRNRILNHNWPIKLFHHSSHSQHPLKHLLLIGLFFESLTCFLQAVRETTERGIQRPVRRRIVAGEPKPMMRSMARYGRPRIDWNSRDERFQRAVRKMAEAIRSISDGPLRVSRQAVLSRLINRGGLSLENLPKTRQALQEVCETVDQFRLRMMRLSVEKIKRDGDAVTITRMRQYSGVRKERSSELMEEALEIIVENHGPGIPRAAKAG